jgi:YVTN family beta-propeller protein
VQVARWVSDPVRPRLYGLDSQSRHVYVFDTSTLTLVQTITLGSAPERGAASPDGSRLYITNAFNGKIMRIDLETFQILTPLVIADSSPYDVQIGADGYLYLAVSSGLEKVDSKTGEVKSSIHLMWALLLWGGAQMAGRFTSAILLVRNR